MTKRTVFVDRDNTIIADCPYCSRKEDVKLMDGAAEAVQLLNSRGIRVVVVTNQSGVGRGYFTIEQMEEVNSEMFRQLGEHGAHIDALYYCPHTPDDGCDCRKPKTGLVERARKDLGESEEFVIGDRDEIDGEMARRAGLGFAIVGMKSLLDAVREYLESADGDGE